MKNVYKTGILLLELLGSSGIKITNSEEVDMGICATEATGNLLILDWVLKNGGSGFVTNTQIDELTKKKINLKKGTIKNKSSTLYQIFIHG